ncbi:MAG: OmpP1/FadL family transporter [Desulfatiglandales bacterium]
MIWKRVVMLGFKKRAFILLVVSIFLGSQTTFVYAGAYEWGGLGERAQSMGGAFIGLADDWTAIYWNPAGLTQLKGARWGFDFLSPHPVMKDGNSLSNLPAANMDTKYQIDTFVDYAETLGLPVNEPDRFNKTKVQFHFYNPNGLGGYWQCEVFTMGAGFYIPVGHYFDWEDELSYGAGTIRAKLFQSLALMIANLSVAKEVHPRFSLGAGLELIYGKIDYDAEKTVINSGILDYAWGFDSNCDGIGFEGVFGGLFKITDQVSLGGVYRTGSSLELKGTADTQLTLAVAPFDEKSDFTQKFPHPSTWGLGLAYKPMTNLTLTADFQRTNWSEFKIDVDYDIEGTALTDKDYSADWKDSNRYRFGVEYKPTERWSLRGGYFFDESSLPDKSVSFSNIADVDRHNIILGTGYEWKKSWKLELLYGYSWGDRTANSVDYSQRVNSFGITVAHKF